ncbi:ScbR family autoregulator-binding transcription factor [Streptantibioticus silvisoli]|uniref:ScbR family autoregulator-binding transcription factor n=1 Tax=Streptantibioticus silvisoli TaxID=2705255 RepID=A0ABT6W5Z2_9ACTN|nr:ScbR family autoregulator-binding transcription factor [Streptantibioticus silvisoli]MDI5966173.1 ScbR family autoregulator-binding transcription factor [Streptantibioticus silvisoli]
MQVRAARTRQALILAAAELIDDRGMKGTGLLDISRAAGVSKGALYFHFASKDELVAAVRQEARASVMATAEHCLDGRTCTLAGAARFTVAMSRRMRADPVLRAGLRLDAEGVTGERTGGGSLRAGWLTLLRERLTADAAQGRLRPGVDPDATASLLAAVTVGLESMGRENDAWWEPRVTTGIWQLLLDLAATDPRTTAEVDRALAELRADAEAARAEAEAAARQAAEQAVADGPAAHDDIVIRPPAPRPGHLTGDHYAAPGVHRPAAVRRPAAEPAGRLPGQHRQLGPVGALTGASAYDAG